MVVLKNNKLFSGMLAAELQALEQTAQLNTYKAGRNVFQEGDPGDGLYIIVEGKVQITCLVGQDQRRVLSRLGAGDFFGEMAVMDNSTLEMRQAAKNRIRKQIDRLSNMINELLEFTRGSASTVVLARTDYAEFVKQLVEDIRPEIDAKSVKLELENEPPVIALLLDPTRLPHVFYNIINNACDAMTEGGKVKIRFKQNEKEVVTEIEDTGKGIAPEIAPRLFEAFATYGKSQGTGLGVSICKKIVEDHYGKISARSEPGRGAIFSFSLPIRREEEIGRA